MAENNKSNYEFLKNIIEKISKRSSDQKSKEIVNTLTNIYRKGTAAESMIYISPLSCLDHCGECCEAIAHLFVMCLLPEDWSERINKKNREKSEAIHAIWTSDEYIEAFVNDGEDLDFYIELFHLKGEYNCEKHNVKDSYTHPVKVKKSTRIRRNSDHSVYMEKKNLTKVEQKHVLWTSNLLNRCQQIYEYLSSVLVKCKLCKKEEIPEYEEPEKRSAASDDVFNEMNERAVEVNAVLERTRSIFDQLKDYKIYENKTIGEEECENVIEKTEKGTPFVYKDEEGRKITVTPKGAVCVEELEDGEANGRRTTVTPAGIVCVEEIEDGKANGRRTMVAPEGDVCVEEIEDGEANGRRTTVTLAGIVCVEEIEDGEANGRRTMVAPEGDVCVEEIEDGEANGRRTMVHTEGDVFVMEMKDGEANGRRTTVTPEGVVFVMEMKDGEANGRRTMVAQKGTVYVDEMEDGEANGRRTTVHTEGDVYVEELEDGEANGRITTVTPEGVVFVMEMKDGEENGRRTTVTPEGDVYVEEMKDGEENGRRTMVAQKGTVYVDEMEDGEENGRRTTVTPEGDVYVEEMEDGEWTRIM